MLYLFALKMLWRAFSTHYKRLVGHTHHWICFLYASKLFCSPDNPFIDHVLYWIKLLYALKVFSSPYMDWVTLGQSLFYGICLLKALEDFSDPYVPLVGLTPKWICLLYTPKLLSNRYMPLAGLALNLICHLIFTCSCSLLNFPFVCIKALFYPLHVLSWPHSLFNFSFSKLFSAACIPWVDNVLYYICLHSFISFCPLHTFSYQISRLYASKLIYAPYVPKLATFSVWIYLVSTLKLFSAPYMPLAGHVHCCNSFVSTLKLFAGHLMPLVHRVFYWICLYIH